MRAVNKGVNTKRYDPYEDARLELANEIGWYCSYCEMPGPHMFAIEHVIPVANRGDEHHWHNFLLSCFHCNSTKGDSNVCRTQHYWPDEDNTFIAFEYNEVDVIKPAVGLTAAQRALAKNTIDLLGLNRVPLDPAHEATDRDVRWISRDSAWEQAWEAHSEYISGLITANSIARNAMNSHFSIWMEVFKNEPEVLDAIAERFSGTDINCCRQGQSKGKI